MIIQKMLAYICLAVSYIFGLQTEAWIWEGGYGNDGALCERTFFASYGPRILILRNRKFWQVTGLFTVVARYTSCSNDNKLISCHILIRTLKKTDRIIYGEQNIREYHPSH